MNKVIEELMRTCLYISDDETFHYSSLYKEVLAKMNDDNIDLELKQDTLIEMYRFAYYSRARKELDAVTDTHDKENILKLMISEVSLTNIIEFRKFNDSLRRAIDNPLDYIEKKYPGDIK